MKELTIGKLKAGFSRIIDDILAGEEYTVLRGKKKQKVALIIPYPRKGIKASPEIKMKRILGRDKGAIVIKDDFDKLPDDILKSFGIK